MRPILLELGPLRVHAYGFALAVSFLLGSFWIGRRGRRLGYSEDELSKLFFWLLASALIGSRLYYAFQHPEDFAGDWLDVFRIWRGGLSEYGGVIGAVFAAWMFARSRAWSFRALADVAAPAIALGEAITRLGGCFMAGCCHGLPTTLPWGVRYPPGSPAWDLWPDAAVQPSPLYLALGNTVLFLVLARLSRRLAGSGRLFSLYLAGSSLLRFAVDFTRYYVPSDWHTLLGVRLTHSQWFGFLLLLLAAVLWLRPAREAAASRAASEEAPAHWA